MANNIFDPLERALAKQASRDRDDRDLAEGRVDANSLRRHNGFIPGDSARNAVIREWKEFD
jgi:hypothetical protein